MHISKVLLTTVFCATCAWCGDETLGQNGRTIDLTSYFAWPQALFRNPLSIFPKLWSRGSQLSEWTKSGIKSFLRFTSLLNAEEPMRIEFDPDDGPRRAAAYRRCYGYRGQLLIERLRNGIGPYWRFDCPELRPTYS